MFMTKPSSWGNRLRGRSPDAPDSEAAADMRARNREWRRHTYSHTNGLQPLVDPERDHLRGDENAKLVLVEYGDYASESCRAAVSQVHGLRRRFGDELLFVFRNFTIVDAHPNAFSAAAAAEAAGAQGRFWEMHDKIYASEFGLEPAATRSFAQEITLDIDRFDRESSAEKQSERVFEDFDSGVSSGVNGTPTFFINGVRLDWDFETSTLSDALDAASGGGRMTIDSELERLRAHALSG
jgi:NhaA family Na+:H+ antiporter